MSKSMAKRSMGVRVIEQPRSAEERWLVETVQRQARQAGIGMPEVGVFDSPQPNAFATGMNKQRRPGGGEHRSAAPHAPR
jgi:heat shock protein HtpX